MPHFLSEYVRAPRGVWRLTNATTGAVVAGTVRPAFDRESRNKGLLGQDGWPTGSALILAPCSGVHTWFMRFPIDILFVARDGQVLKVRRAVRPWRLAIRLGAFAVVELAAGSADGTEAGHTLTLARPGI